MSYDRVSEPTLASTWHAVSGGAVTDELLDWPPDVFALTNVILARSGAFRFALSPIEQWLPRAIRTGGAPSWREDSLGLRGSSIVAARRPSSWARSGLLSRIGPICPSRPWPRGWTHPCASRC